MKDNIRRLYAEFETEHFHIAGTPFHPLDDPPFEAREILKSLPLFQSIAPLFDDALEVMTLARNRLELDSDSWRHGIEVIRQYQMALFYIGKGNTLTTAVRRAVNSYLWPNIDNTPDDDLLALFALGGGWWALKCLAAWALDRETAYARTSDYFKAVAVERFTAFVDPARETLGRPLPQGSHILAARIAHGGKPKKKTLSHNLSETRRLLDRQTREEAAIFKRLTQHEQENRERHEARARQQRRLGGMAPRKAHRPYKARALVAFRAERLRPDGRPRQLEELAHRIYDRLAAIPSEALPAGASMPSFDTLKGWLRPHWRRCKRHHQKGG